MTPDPVGCRRALECLLGVPVTDGNHVDVLRNGAEAFPAMLQAVEEAAATIDFQGYGHWSGSVGEDLARALAGRAAAGLRVRVLLDAFGTRHIERRLLEVMADAGVEVVWFRPLTNWRVTQSTHRGHRRILVCDADVAFTGGMGIADDWDGDAQDRSRRRDTALRLRGPAVNGLKGAFVNNWAETARPLFDENVDRFPLPERAGDSSVQVVAGDAETGWGDISTLARVLVGLARQRVRITADYFVPDVNTLKALCDAAQRGVTVDIMRPAPPGGKRLSGLASQAHYEPLLRAGARVWSFLPTALDTKVITVDGLVAAVGPVNFNSRSLTLNDEVNVVVLDRDVVAVLDGHFDHDLTRSVPVELDQWARRNRAHKVEEATVGFFARHL